jgi:hypothetical protein
MSWTITFSISKLPGTKKGGQCYETTGFGKKNIGAEKSKRSNARRACGKMQYQRQNTSKD